MHPTADYKHSTRSHPYKHSTRPHPSSRCLATPAPPTPRPVRSSTTIPPAPQAHQNRIPPPQGAPENTQSPGKIPINLWFVVGLPGRLRPPSRRHADRAVPAPPPPCPRCSSRWFRCRWSPRTRKDPVFPEWAENGAARKTMRSARTGAGMFHFPDFNFTYKLRHSQLQTCAASIRSLSEPLLPIIHVPFRPMFSPMPGLPRSLPCPASLDRSHAMQQPVLPWNSPPPASPHQWPPP